MTDQEIVTLANGRQLTAGEFYQERDQRMPSNPSASTHEISIAIVAPEEILVSVSGQTALIWGASLIRRMGRSFADVKLIAPANASASKYEGGLHRELEISTLGDAIEVELAGADPFAPITWRDIADPAAFRDVRFAIWIGGRAASLPVPPGGVVVVRARGWVVEIDQQFAGASSRQRRESDAAAASMVLDAAAATIIAGVSFAVGASYSAAQSNLASVASSVTTPTLSPSEPPLHSARYWYSVDTGSATTDVDEGEVWLGRGSSQNECAPWRSDQGEAPRLPALVLVSAGGLNSNFAHTLSQSYAKGSTAAVIDPDHVDISNLNRLVGVSLGDVGSSKASLVSSALDAAGFETTAHEQRYESWATTHRGVLDAEDIAAIVGVDQVLSRLEAQADWPALLFNGSTAGTSWNVSWHPRGGGCVGCLYATDQRPYAVTRGPQACAAAGIANPIVQRGGSPLDANAAGNERQAAASADSGFDISYPFVSISAAAVMVAICLRLSWSTQAGKTSSSRFASGVVRANALRPAFGQVGSVEYHTGCLLLCQHPALDEFFGRTQTIPSLDNDADGQWP